MIHESSVPLMHTIHLLVLVTGAKGLGRRICVHHMVNFSLRLNLTDTSMLQWESPCFPCIFWTVNSPFLYVSDWKAIISVSEGKSLHENVKPSQVQKLKDVFVEEKFLLSQGKSWTYMVWEQDALRGCLVATYAKSMRKIFNDPDDIMLQDAYDKMNDVFNPFLYQVQAKGWWYTDRFLDGTGTRFAR